MSEPRVEGQNIYSRVGVLCTAAGVMVLPRLNFVEIVRGVPRKIQINT